MKKGDLILMFSLMALSLILLIPALKATTSTADQVLVQVSNEEVMRLDLHTNQSVEVQGVLGPVRIEVKDGKVAVVQENSPHHYCSYQGFVSNPKTPIICLPNETIVQIVSNEASEEDVIIQ